MKRNNLSNRKVAHTDNGPSFSASVKKKIIKFHNAISVFRMKFNYDNAFVINMDETDVFFDYKTTTVEEKGSKFVAQLQLGEEKKKVTCVLTATANGTLLPPMIIHNQKNILELESNEFQNKPIFCWSDSGWMDSDLMLVWFRRILLPYINRKRTLLVFDCDKAHLSKDFEEEIEKYDNIDLILIPGGLTYLLQPLDVSCNKSLKSKIRKEYRNTLDKFNTRILESQNEINQNPTRVSTSTLEIMVSIG